MLKVFEYVDVLLSRCHLNAMSSLLSQQIWKTNFRFLSRLIYNKFSKPAYDVHIFIINNWHWYQSPKAG